MLAIFYDTVGALQIVATPNFKRLVLKLQCIDFDDLGADSRGFGGVESEFRALGTPICRKWALRGGNNFKGLDSMGRFSFMIFFCQRMRFWRLDRYLSGGIHNQNSCCRLFIVDC